MAPAPDQLHRAYSRILPNRLRITPSARPRSKLDFVQGYFCVVVLPRQGRGTIARHALMKSVQPRLPIVCQGKRQARSSIEFKRFKLKEEALHRIGPVRTGAATLLAYPILHELPTPKSIQLRSGIRVPPARSIHAQSI